MINITLPLHNWTLYLSKELEPKLQSHIQNSGVYVGRKSFVYVTLSCSYIIGKSEMLETGLTKTN